MTNNPQRRLIELHLEVIQQELSRTNPQWWQIAADAGQIVQIAREVARAKAN